MDPMDPPDPSGGGLPGNGPEADAPGTGSPAPAAGAGPLTALAAALLDTERLITGLGRQGGAPGRATAALPPGPADPAAAQIAVDRLTRRLGVPPVGLAPGAPGSAAAELALGARLAGGLGVPPGPPGAPGDDGAPYERAAADALAALPERRDITTPDGTRLTTLALGPADAPPVVLAPPCGMPYGLMDPWMRALAPDHRVLTWETRGLFALDEDFDDRPWDVAAQAGDLVEVIRAWSARPAHVMGLCGGAAIALAAARSPLVASLSLWHGDWELGPDAPKTQHQQDVQQLLRMVGANRRAAGSMQRMLRRPTMLAGLRADLAHHLIYPYADPELLYRYGRLNGAIMTTDCRALCEGVDTPVLVVSSTRDTTAHPEGSTRVAGLLPGARLLMRDRGDHLSAFDAGGDLVALARDFVAATAPGAPPPPAPSPAPSAPSPAPAPSLSPSLSDPASEESPA